MGGVDAGVRHALAFSDARITEGQGLGGGLMAIGKSFVESLLTELLILCVVRTWRPIFPGRPGRLLVLSSVGVAFLALLLPYLPAIAGWFGLVPMPLSMLIAIFAISLLYAAASEAEAEKHRFRHLYSPAPVIGSSH